MTQPNVLPPIEPPAALVTDPRPPSPCHSRDDREALELHEIQTREDNELNESSASASSGDEYRITTRRTTSRATQQSRKHRTGLWGRLCRFWTHHVTITVPHKGNRDHYALERTFLAYIRTSVVIAMQGVVNNYSGFNERHPRWTAFDSIKSASRFLSPAIVWLFWWRLLELIDSGGSRVPSPWGKSMREVGN